MKNKIGAAVIAAALTVTLAPAASADEPTCGDGPSYAQVVQSGETCRISEADKQTAGWWIDAVRFLVDYATRAAEVSEARRERIVRMKEIIDSKNALIQSLRDDVRQQ